MEINTATDLSYSILDLIGRNNFEWSKVNNDYSSGLVIVTNTGADESIISLTNLKWTFKNEGENFKIKNGTGTVTLTPKTMNNIPKAIAFAGKSAAMPESTVAPAVYEKGKVTLTVTTGSNVESLIVRDSDGNVIDPGLLDITFANQNDGVRQWTVTVTESEPGSYVFYVYPQSDGFTYGEPVTAAVTIESEIVEDTANTETPGTDEPAESETVFSIIRRIRNLFLSFIELIRQLLACFGIHLA